MNIMANSNTNRKEQPTIKFGGNNIGNISLNKDNYTNKALKENKIFAVSILSVDTPKEVIGTLAPTPAQLRNFS